MPKKTDLRIALLCGLLLSPLGLADRQALAESQSSEGPSSEGPSSEGPSLEGSVAVDLSSGRTFTGQLDRRTDLTHLWLRWQRGLSVVLRPIRWDRVVKARIDGQELSGEQFRSIVETVRRDLPEQAHSADTPKEIVINASGDGSQSAAITGVEPGHVSHASHAPQVRSVVIDAVIANWDADVEMDGLIVHVYPLDAEGAVVPARGTLQVSLNGQRLGVVKRSGRFPSLARWVRTVRSGDFGYDGAVYRLPFQSVHPEFDLEVAAYGAVHARLSVPGQGTFETTTSTVRIRQFSPFRDDLQQATGSRFLPFERTGRGRR